MGYRLPLLILDAVLLLGAGGLGFRLGSRWQGRRMGRDLGDPTLPGRLEAMARAREAAELANAELQKALFELERAAGTDRLTGAWNRRRFEEGATAMMALANRQRDPLPLILFDVDHFKDTNDTYGHDAGDKALMRIVEIVRSQLRASDSITRWGGDEFMILAPGTYLAGATLLAEKVRRALEVEVFADSRSLTLSLGVVEYRPGETLQEWVKRADQALYRAKEEGRNRVVTLGEPVVPPLRREATPMLELRWERSLECGNLTLDAQHRELFDLINGLLASIASFPDAAEVGLRLQVFQTHLAQHFLDEEAILESVGYPARVAHGCSHSLIINKINHIRKELRDGKLELSQVLGFLAVEVVRDHLVLEDKDFFSRMRG